MKVGLEVSAVVASRRSGVGNYIANMLVGLEKIAENNPDLDLLYYSNRIDELQSEQVIQFKPDNIYAKDRFPVRTMWMQLGLPRSLNRTQPDLCHFPNYLAPVLRPVNIPYVATIYDMCIYRCPEFLPLKTLSVHRAIVPTVAKTAKLIITISETARQDLLHYLKVPQEQVRVVQGSVGAHFQTESLKIIAGQPAQDKELRQRYGLDFPYILSVGTLEPRKNHARLIEAFTRLIQQENLPHHLVLVGAHGWKEKPLIEQLQKCKLLDRIHFLGYVRAADLPGIYRLADVFAFPSLYEGFGLPVLEAMACATPCLISTDPALLEVAGQTAMVVNPHSSEAIAAGLYSLLTNKKYSDTLRNQGLVRATGYTWEKCAAETFEVYKEALQNHGRPVYWGAVAMTPVANFKPSEPPNFELQELEAVPSLLEKAILETIIYADIFNFPLTREEIHQYLIGQAATLNEVTACVTVSTYLKKFLACRAAYVGLRNHEENFAYRQSLSTTLARHWQAARFWCGWLRWIPFLRSAIITGSLAAGGAKTNDDIDLLLLVEPGRLWLCRALVIGVVHLARLNGIELCPNYIMTVRDSVMSVSEHNIYTAREFASTRLMFGEIEYQQLMKLNAWTEELLPNMHNYSIKQTPVLGPGKFGKLRTLVKNFGEKLLGGRLGEKIERWEQRKIKQFSKPEASEACFTPELCKGHFGNYGNSTLAAFTQRRAIINSPTPNPIIPCPVLELEIANRSLFVD